MTLTIYSKPGCHLCDDMKTIVCRVAQRMPGRITVEEVDISSDPGLETRYRVEIPVLMIDGTRVAKYRITEAELTRAIDARQP